MRMRVLCSILAGVAIGVWVAFLFWMGGYNFDRRGDVAVGFAVAEGVASFFMAFATFSLSEDYFKEKP